MKDRRLFIVANRLPLTISNENGEMIVVPTSGGLVSAIQSYLKMQENNFSQIYWAGVPGCAPAVWKEAERLVENDSFTFLPVMVYKDQYERYYNGFSNSLIWPLFHYFPSFAEYQQENFEAYKLVNEHFLEALIPHCREGDTVWIHDYHLLPLARMLRASSPSLSVGFFLHIPFPSFELIRLLPRTWQEELLKGLLGADLIGFHTMDYASHFLQSVQQILGLTSERNILRYGARLIKIDVFPISIDYELFNRSFSDPIIEFQRRNLLQKLKGKKIIFSVDRLDYTKGVINRLRAFQLFLLEHQEFMEKVVFILVIVPSRDKILKYAERKRMIDELISQINSELGNIHWQPINYHYHSLTFPEMLTLYTSCDVALITPLRDGMNLVAKEFVASRNDRKGVLILSEMAGAARELTDSLLINPNDIGEISAAIRQALIMKEEEQEERMGNMQKRIRNYNVQHWAEDFLDGLERIKKKQLHFQEKFLDEFSKRDILESYQYSHKRLLLLNYDGTLIPYSSDPENALPGEAILSLLEALGSDPQNHLYLISGRSSDWLQNQFGKLPINLIGEHGAKIREKGKNWVTEVRSDSDWKENIKEIMEIYERRCAHSFIEEKEFSLVWHYRKASKEQGELRALELCGELHRARPGKNIEIIQGDKIIEVRNSGIDKGLAVRKLLAREEYDFVFAVGDDKTDEEVFRLLTDIPHCFTIKVGPKSSYAQYNLLKPQMVISLLGTMQFLSSITKV